jgi:hypothetical protein
MALKDRDHGFQLLEIEKNLLFNKDNEGFVRYKGNSKKIFYLDPSPFLETKKFEIFVTKNCPSPPSGTLIKVNVAETEDFIHGNLSNLQKTIIKYINSWEKTNPKTLIKRRRALYLDEYIDYEEFLNFFKEPYKGESSTLEKISLCSALFTVSSPRASVDEKGGLNAAVLAKKDQWAGFKKSMNVIPQEFKRATSKNFYKISNEEEFLSPINSMEVNLAYLNPISVPAHIPVSIHENIEAKPSGSYKENIDYEIPMVRAFILDSLLIQPEIPSNLDSYITNCIYKLIEDFKGSGYVPYKQDLGSTIPKLSLSIARLYSELTIEKKDVTEIVDLWSDMFFAAKKAVSTQFPISKLYKLSDNARKLYIELDDTFGTDILIEKKEAIKITSLFEWSFNEALCELNNHGLLIKPNPQQIKLLDFGKSK